MKLQKTREQYSAYTRNFYIKYRTGLMKLLGNKCSNPNCLVPGGCTDVRALQFDHINGRGTQEVRLRGNMSLYRKYLNDPDLARKTLQILCANCNSIKRVERKEATGRPKLSIDQSKA